MKQKSSAKIILLILGGILTILLVILVTLPALNRLVAVRVADGNAAVITSAPLPDKPAVRRFCRNAGTDFAEEIICFGIISGTMNVSALEMALEVLRDGDCISLNALRINGKVLRSMGVPPKDIGRTLEWLLEGVMDDRLENRGAVLKRAVRAELRKAKERTEQTNEGSTPL